MNRSDSVDRIQAMVDDDGGTWDLSPNDKDALKTALAFMQKPVANVLPEESGNESVYRGYIISYNPPPIPQRTMDFQFVHTDYDGPEDCRCGYGESVEHCEGQIDELIEELRPEPIEEGTATFSYAHIINKANSWDSFCNDVGLSPYFLKEGRAQDSDKHTAPISVWKRHGIL